MRLFIDSSDHVLWAKYRKAGWAFGATTNPLILQKDGKSCGPATYQVMVQEAKNAGLRELQIQATGDLLKTGTFIAGLWDRIVVKIPLTLNGLDVAANLIASGARVTLTAAYSTHQMVAAAAIGAEYIAPYYGRIHESGRDADSIVDAMKAIAGPRVLVASLRTLNQLETLAARGHDTFTLSPELCALLGQDELSDLAAADFEKACLAGQS